MNDDEKEDIPPANIPARISGWLSLIVAGAIVAAYLAHRLPAYTAGLAETNDFFSQEGWMFVYWYAYGLAMIVTAYIFKPMLFARGPSRPNDEENDSP